MSDLDRSSAVFESIESLRSIFLSQIPQGWKYDPDTSTLRNGEGVTIGLWVCLDLKSAVAPHLIAAGTNATYAAVLIPWGETNGLAGEYRQHGITVIQMRDRKMYAAQRKPAPGVVDVRIKKFDPDLPDDAPIWGPFRVWFELNPVEGAAS